MTTFSSGTNSYTVPSPATRITIYVRGGEGGVGGDASFDGVGGNGGLGGEIIGELAVSSGDSFTANVGANGGNGGDAPDSSTGGAGGVGGSGVFNGGDGSVGDVDAGGGGGGGGGGGAASIFERDSDGAFIGVGEGGGGAAGGGNQDDGGNTSGGGGGGGSRGGLGGTAGQNPDGEDAEGSGNGGDGGDGSTGDGENGFDGGVDSHGDLAVVSTGTTTTNEIVVIEHVVWDTPGLSVSTVTDTSVELNWTDAEFEAEYLIEYRESGGTYTTFGTVSSGTTTETVTGLDNGIEYDFRVTAQNQASGESATVTTTTVLPAPTNLGLNTKDADSISVTWTANHSNGDTRIEYREDDTGTWVVDNTVAFSTTSETIFNLLNGQLYGIRVVAETAYTETVDQ